MYPDILTIGEPMVEFNQTGERTYLQGFGGDTSNAAIAAARQGARAGCLTALGTDLFGDMVMDLWAREGVWSEAVKRDADAPTAIYFVTHSEGGHSFTYRRAGSAASRYGAADLDRAALKAAKVVHASGISLALGDTSRGGVLAAFEIARAAGSLVSLDTNLRLNLWPLEEARAAIHEAAALADILLPGLDDARHLTGLDDADSIADFYLELGARIVALTLGADGALIATADRRERFAAHRVTPVDATGAGDTFDGAFLCDYLQTGDPFAAGRHANAAAALSTTGYGAVEPMPRRAEVAAFIAGNATVLS